MDRRERLSLLVGRHVWTGKIACPTEEVIVMSNAPYDLRDYVLDELTPQQCGEVEQFLATSVEAREEVERLRLTHQALLSVPEEEVPRRIAFVSDKVFEPSRARRLWQGFWQGAPRLAFGTAAVLAVLFAGAWATQPSVTSDENGWRVAFGTPAPLAQPALSTQPGTPDPSASAQPVVETAQQLTPAQVHQVGEILRESESRQRDALAELLRSETVLVQAGLRAEIEQIRRASEENYQFQKARWDRLDRDLAEGGAIAMVGR
jgi:anti-sigma factor RsiW